MMDSSNIVPDAASLVSCSADSSAEAGKTEKFKTSVNVSSLAEKFEKSGDFSKSEEKGNANNELVSTSQVEGKSAAENKPNVSNGNDIAPGPSSESKNSAIDEFSTNTNGINDVKIKCNECSVSQPTSSAGMNGDGNINIYQDSELITEEQIAKAVQEKVAYLAEKTSSSSLKSICTTAVKNNSTAVLEGEIVKTVSRISFKDLEQSFVNALHMVNSNEKKTGSSEILSVPSIEITEASDREDTSSEDTAEIKLKKEVDETQVQTPVLNKVEESNTKQNNDNTIEPTPSAITASRSKVESETSPEERKAVFYISSSDLPGEQSTAQLTESMENSEELNHEDENEEFSEPTTLESNETRTTSCLRSKSVHGVTFLTSFIVAIFGFILYNMAHEGKVPDFCEHVGLVTAILAGIIGAFSCFCYTCLESFPGLEFSGYERIIPQDIPSKSEVLNANDQNLDDSWSSEKERAFRIQNGMSSTRTSATSIKSNLSEFMLMKQSDHRELVNKTESLKKDLVGLLDSFSNMMAKLKPADEVSVMESGMVNG